MNFKEHITAAAITSVPATMVISNTQDIKENSVIAMFVLIGGIFPDIDTHSHPSKIFAMAGFILATLLLYLGDSVYSALIGIAFMICKTGKHRGWTHKYSLPVLLMIASFWIPYFEIIQAFAVGLVVHYLIDRMSIWRFKNWV